MARSNEPIWWSLFSAGGEVSALLMPVTVLLTGLAVPAGLLTQQSLFNVLHHPLARLYLFVLISLSLFHAAHRTRLTLAEVGLRPVGGLLAVLCYGAAILGTLLAIYFLLRL